MFEYAAFCDLCVGEEPVPLVAVGQYKNDDGDTYHYCRKHVGMVRKSGLKPEPFQHPGDSRKLAGLE